MSSDIPASSGIYRITCIPTGKFYIGSAINLQKRWREHRHYLAHQKHPNPKLQHAWNKHGAKTFAFEVVELTLIPLLIEREQYWINELNPFFNINRTAGSRLGMRHSLETREKLRQANLGKKHSEETIRKRTQAGIGRTHSKETREKLRAIGMGHPVSDEAREHMRIAQLGKKQSEEAIEKRRLKQLGRPVSEATRDKLRSKMSDAKAASKKTLIVTSPDGETFTIHGIGQFCNEHNLNRSALTQVARGKANHHKGWTARFPS